MFLLLLWCPLIPTVLLRGASAVTYVVSSFGIMHFLWTGLSAVGKVTIFQCHGQEPLKTSQNSGSLTGLWGTWL